ncbi:MAG: cation:proton antiporter [Candidatus Rokuibacteriota bacterium]|nr:MAG: cation:proton antiporter [Candidatus Rokubacteria bacterium]PYM67963.1 MAG: cation:proton antiporter [Candidatus Rokubacteria bacterium]PYN67304.1 MAG: cation:proton antiporter [Candidatus Rokubacteria bacterium]
MENLLIAVIAGLLVLLASVASVELGVSVALIEISLGVVAGNFLGLTSPPWMDFLAAFGSILLTFLAGAEVDARVMQEKLKESVLIGGLSFAAPFVGAWLFCAWVLGWSTPAAQIAGVALSTTSLAVVYTVLVETGLTLTPIGKLIMASTFVTDFGTALALALLFIRPTWWLVPFLGVSVLVIWAMVALQPWFFARYGERVIEPEIKGAVAALLVLMFFADKAQSHAVLPAFVLGLAVARIFHEHPELTRRFRVVAFALLTPFFFLKGGMNVSLKLVWANLGLLGLLFTVKQVTKIAGVYPLAKRWVPVNAMFTTLLMSTGLTFGTISSLYGLNAGILDRAQFSVLVTVVVASAVIPTVIAQRWFSPGPALRRAAPPSASPAPPGR